MIFTETQYEIYDSDLLAIVRGFKTWKYYLEDYKYEVFMLVDNNNL